MRKFLVPSLVIALALLIAVPSFALEVKWGGLFRARVISQSVFEGNLVGLWLWQSAHGSGAIDPTAMSARTFDLSQSTNLDLTQLTKTPAREHLSTQAQLSQRRLRKGCTLYAAPQPFRSAPEDVHRFHLQRKSEGRHQI